MRALLLLILLLFGSTLHAQTAGQVSAEPGQLAGTATNDSAGAGNVGELKFSTISSGSPVSLTNTTSANITSISLTPGDWDVSGSAVFTGNSSTTVTVLACSMGTTTGTLNQNPGQFSQQGYSNFALFGASAAVTCDFGPYRVSLSATTTYYMVALADFTTSTAAVFGHFRARRVR